MKSKMASRGPGYRYWKRGKKGQSPDGVTKSAERDGSLGPVQTSASQTTPVERTWGFRINKNLLFPYTGKAEKAHGGPRWLQGYQLSTWQEEGLIVWNGDSKRIERLHGQEALALLNQLISDERWKSEGIPITHLVYEFTLPASSRRKKKEVEPNAEPKKVEPVHKEFLRLPPEAGPELIQLLQSNQQFLSELAEREAKQRREALSKVYELLFDFHNKSEQSKFDPKRGSFEWENQEEGKWVCRHQSAEGLARLDKTKIFWNACTRRPGYAGKVERFVRFLEAVEWVEKELVELANQPEAAASQPRIRTEQQREADRARLMKKLKEGPYWIDPSRLEPTQGTYRIFMELDAKPVSFKTYESGWGDKHNYDHVYLSPFKMAGALNLDGDHFKIDQLAGQHSEWFRIISLTTYYQEATVAEQAQKAWDQSRILQKFKEGDVVRARYGYEEVETGFVAFLGGCERPDKPWEIPPSRKECLETQALQESLSFALDVTDYRDYLGVSDKFVMDEGILQMMHRTRACSRFLPEEACRESRVWLAEHVPLESVCDSQRSFQLLKSEII